MSNEPPPPYPGGPTAPLLEEKSGAPPTPGKDSKLLWVRVPRWDCWVSTSYHWLLKVFPDLSLLGSLL